MAFLWKTVRVFISSTFRDMQAERDYLVRFVFPRLREELLLYRIHLVDVDLRWGVTSEQDTLEACREIVDECYPRFLCILGGRYGWIPADKDRSITADEVYYGVLDRSPEHRNYAFFYFRNDLATDAMVETIPGEFREPKGSENEFKLSILKKTIVEAGFNPLMYSAHWDDESRRLIGLKDFGDRVYDDLLSSIRSDSEFQDRFITNIETQIDEFADENAAMEDFVEERYERFVLGSRKNVVDKLLQHAITSDSKNYLCLKALPGSGKSAILAYFSRHPSINSQKSIKMLCHFVGASPASTDIRLTLRRLCHELKKVCPDKAATIPEDPEELRALFLNLLFQTSTKNRIVVLLDAINQFDSSSKFTLLNILTQELPENIRIIFSTTDVSIFYDLRRRSNNIIEIRLNPLTKSDSNAIIEHFLKRYHKQFEPEQRAALLSKDDACLPLYLLTALEELRTMGTFEEITNRINELPPKTLQLFDWILKRLEDDDGFRDSEGRKVGHSLVPHFASLLVSSRFGLSQEELTELLAHDEIQDITYRKSDSRGNVAALLHLLRPYLMYRGELIDFYHSQFRDAAKGAYFKTDAKCQSFHLEIADYFRKKADPEMDYSWKGLCPHAYSELPYHQCQSASWTSLVTTLESLFFLERKVNCGMALDLIKDFADALDYIIWNRNIIPSLNKDYKILQLLQLALRLDIHFIHRHAKDYPQGLFQCFWNSCWWYDCPQAADYYTSTPEIQSRTSKNDEVFLYKLMEQWYDQRTHRYGDFIWIRSLYPPRAPLGKELSIKLPVQKGEVSGISFDPESNRIAIVTRDCKLKIFNLIDGALQLEIKTTDEFHEIQFDQYSGSKLICVGTSSIVIFDSSTGKKISDFPIPNHPREIKISPDKETVFVQTSEDLLIYSLGGKLIHKSQVPYHLKRLSGIYRDKTNSLKSSYFFVSTTDNGVSVEIWSIDLSMKILSYTPVGDFKILGVVISQDGGIAATSEVNTGRYEHRIVIWETGTVRVKSVIKGINTQEILSMIFSPDNSYLLTSGWYPMGVHLWDTISGNHLKFFGGLESSVTSISLSPNLKYVALGCQYGTIFIFNFNTYEFNPIFINDTFFGETAFLDDEKFISWDDAHNQKIWDIKTGRCIKQETLQLQQKHPAFNYWFTHPGEKIKAGIDIYTNETRFSCSDNGIIAWYNAPIGHIHTKTDCRIWIGHRWDTLHLLKLEGSLPFSCNYHNKSQLEDYHNNYHNKSQLKDYHNNNSSDDEDVFNYTF